MRRRKRQDFYAHWPARPHRRLSLLAPLGVIGLVAGILSVSACGGDRGPDVRARGPERASPPPPMPELPRGGRRLFPDYRLVAFYGAPQSEELGILGAEKPAQAARKLERQASQYRRGQKKIMPAFELIATIAAGAPGPSGKYRTRQKRSTVERYLKAARQARALLVLDIQPGREDIMTEVKAFERYLKEPDVGLALDPEWSMRSGQVPGQQIGSTDAATVNEVSGYLAELVRSGNLPEKLLLIHQFTAEMIEDKAALAERPGVALTINVDGFGDRANKLSKYKAFTRASRHHHGFKLFYKEDVNLFAPKDVLGLRPQPEVIVYE